MVFNQQGRQQQRLIGSGTEPPALERGVPVERPRAPGAFSILFSGGAQTSQTTTSSTSVSFTSRLPLHSSATNNNSSTATANTNEDGSSSLSVSSTGNEALVAELVQTPGNLPTSGNSALPTATPSLPMVTAKPVASKRRTYLVAVILALVFLGIAIGVSVSLTKRNSKTIVQSSSSSNNVLPTLELPDPRDRSGTSSTLAALWQANVGCHSNTVSRPLLSAWKRVKPTEKVLLL